MSSTMTLQLPEAQLMFHVKHQPEQERESNVMFHVKHDEAEATADVGQFNAKEAAAAQTKLLLAGGRAPAKAWLQALGKDYTVYCADKGASYALEVGLSPALVVGDCDSAAHTVYERAHKLGAKLDIHPPAKDDTDLQLLLEQLPQCQGMLVATGIWGGRFDHLYSNVYSLLAYKEKQGCQVVLADDQELLVLLTANESVEVSLRSLSSVQAISLLPLAASSSVSITGVRWPLQEAELTQQRPYAISNEPLASKLACTCHYGKIGLYFHWQVD
ncbi:MAG: thiamine diphosphokinase [Phascolarctobacterium sp.]